MIEPYYDHAGITIYHGDCREILPQLEPVDLVLTDPPYGIQGSGKVQMRGSVSPTDYINDSFMPVDWVNLCRTGDTAALFWFHDHKRATDVWSAALAAGWKPKQYGIWDKGNRGLNPRHNFVNAYEQFLYAVKGDPWIGGGSRINVFRRPRGMRETDHPTEKPVQLMGWLMSAVAASYVLDPFMGSGSALVAAKSFGCKAIGIEIEEKYCEIAAKRMSQEVLDFG